METETGNVATEGGGTSWSEAEVAQRGLWRARSVFLGQEADVRAEGRWSSLL